MIHGTPILAGALLVLVLLPGCPRRPPVDPKPVPIAERRDRPFYEGTERMQAELRALFEQVPDSRGRARAELGQRIIRYGQPALPMLIDALDHDDATVRVFAAWLLGLMRDERALDALAGALTDPDESVRYEAATTMVRLGDRRGLATLIEGLTHPDPRVRGRSIGVLEQVTGSTFGFRADDHKDERAPAVARWNAWLAETHGEQDS